MDKKSIKKKKRAKRVKRQLMLMREAKHKKDKEKLAWEEKLERETNPNPIKQKPFRRDVLPLTEEELTAKRIKEIEIKEKLERNMLILKALEDEWKKEQLAKSAANAKLEGEGALDIKSKMDLLQQKMLEKAEQDSL